MCNKKDIVKKVYEDLLKDKKTFETLKIELSKKTQLDEAFICKHILPLAKKVDPEITWQDILAYEKEALSQPTELTLNDLENISGGKASNVLMSFGLLALMGFSGLAASNVASADFIPFSETKEVQEYRAFKENPSPTEEDKKKFEFVDLGEVPFYLQADHMVDGLLWFRSPDEDKAFFVMDRNFDENRRAVYTYKGDSSKPAFNMIKEQEYKLFNINELEGYLKESFNDAETKSFEDKGLTEAQTLQRKDDNPLYNFSRFFNKDFTFNSEERTKAQPKFAVNNIKSVSMSIGTKDSENIESFSKKHVVAAGTPQTGLSEENSSHRKQQENSAKKAIASREAFDRLDWDEEIRQNPDLLDFARNLKEDLKKQISWKIAHRTEVGWSGKPGFNTIESAKTLREISPYNRSNTGIIDTEILRNTGFTFFTLQPDQLKRSKPRNLFNCKIDLAEAVFDFDNIPLVSCSADLAAIYGRQHVCFNGSSEEVKEQLTMFYANQEIKKRLLEKNWSIEDFKENKENLINEIREQLRKEALEIRIPTSVAVNKWTILKDGLVTEESLIIKPNLSFAYPKIQLGSGLPHLQIKPISTIPLIVNTTIPNVLQGPIFYPNIQNPFPGPVIKAPQQQIPSINLNVPGAKITPAIPASFQGPITNPLVINPFQGPVINPDIKIPLQGNNPVTPTLFMENTQKTNIGNQQTFAPAAVAPVRFSDSTATTQKDNLK